MPRIFRNDPDPGRPSIFRFEAVPVSTDILIDSVVSIDAVIDMDTLQEPL